MLNLVAQRKPAANTAAANFWKPRLADDDLSAALKAQTARFDAAIEDIPQGVCCFDERQLLVSSNRRFAEIYGLSPERIRPGMTLRDILALRAADDGVARITPNVPTANPTTVRLSNGRVVCVRRQPIAGGGYVSTHEDITERLLAEAALRHGEKLRAIGQMTGGIVHDVNNRLTVIGGNIEDALAVAGDCGGARPQLEAAMQALESAAVLLQRIVSFVRPQPPVAEPTDLNAWLVPLTDMTARLLGPRHRLEFRPDPALRALPVDRSQLESAVLNLILNARDAMPEGGAISVETACVQIADAAAADPPALPAGRYVAITVRDNGSGMPPEVAARALEPFFSTKPVGSGTGLGLSMVQQFALHAGGGVSLRSAPGAGTSVRIVLPGN